MSGSRNLRCVSDGDEWIQFKEATGAARRQEKTSDKKLLHTQRKTLFGQCSNTKLLKKRDDNQSFIHNKLSNILSIIICAKKNCS